MKAYEIIKRHHRGFNLHGFYNRLGLYSRSFSALYSTVYFSPEIAQRKCDQLNKAHQGAIHTYCTINLSEFEVLLLIVWIFIFPKLAQCQTYQPLKSCIHPAENLTKSWSLSNIFFSRF